MPACHAGDRRFESGRVRHLFSRFPYAPSARPDGAFLFVRYPSAVNARDPQYQPRRPQSRLRRSAPALGAAVLVLAVAVPFGGGFFNGPSAEPSATLVGGSSGPPSGTPTAVSPSVAAPTPTPTVTPVPTPATASVPVVPVTHFRTTLTATGWSDVEALVSGAKGRFATLVLVDRDADAILATLRTDRAALGTHLETVPDADALAVALATNRDRLGFLRAEEVGPSVRALAWGPDAMFGVDRVASAAAWPLQAIVPAGTVVAYQAYDPAAAWTMVAGGDILLDRGVSLAIRDSEAGPDFPFNGGAVEITGRCKDCSAFGWDLPYTKRTGSAGAVMDLISGADLAIANFENPAPDVFQFHGKGTVFTANPAYIKGLVNAGIDWVSLANNHIGDAGRTGILQTMDNLDDAGLRHGGTGRNAAEARTPSLLEAGDIKVAILAYDAIAAVYHAGPDKTGSAGLSTKAIVEDVAKAKDLGADVIIVFPHWGVEYRATPSKGQRDIAHAAIDAGADMIIGNHAHWAAAVESYKGKPIWYALGNFVFDQTWSEPTMEGVLLELTFDGDRLVQARMRPHLILDRAQPNFLDPAGDGTVVTDQMFKGSKGLLDW